MTTGTIILLVLWLLYTIIAVIALCQVRMLKREVNRLQIANEKLTHQQQALRELNKYINR
jgi:hypothetical protein